MRMVLYTAIMETGSSVIPPDGPPITVLSGKGWGRLPDNVTVDKRISHHAQYWGILADIFPEEHYDNLFENILPNLPNYYEVVSYEKGYEFLAYAKAGRIKELWDHIYGVFGDWMDQGHTRFPENFMMNASRARQTGVTPFEVDSFQNSGKGRIYCLETECRGGEHY